MTEIIQSKPGRGFAWLHPSGVYNYAKAAELDLYHHGGPPTNAKAASVVILEVSDYERLIEAAAKGLASEDTSNEKALT